TLEELRTSIRERLAAARRAGAQAQLRQKTTEQLARLVDEPIPDALVNHEMQHRAQDIAIRLQAQGIDPQQWLEMTGTSNEELTAELREAADTAVRVDLALRAVADA